MEPMANQMVLRLHTGTRGHDVTGDGMRWEQRPTARDRKDGEGIRVDGRLHILAAPALLPAYESAAISSPHRASG
jgi:hypothetical protein